MPADARATGRRASLPWFCVKFLVLAVACLFIWLQALPYYAPLVGNATALVLNRFLDKPIQDVIVDARGLMNTETELTFIIGGRSLTMRDLGKLTTNIAPFVALVLATSGLAALRRLRILATGVTIIFLSHVAIIALRFVSAGRAAIPNAVGLIAVTLPFLLWIVLAYWDKLLEFFADDDATEDETAPE